MPISKVSGLGGFDGLSRVHSSFAMARRCPRSAGHPGSSNNNPAIHFGLQLIRRASSSVLSLGPIQSSRMGGEAEKGVGFQPGGYVQSNSHPFHLTTIGLVWAFAGLNLATS